jgi:hypothetical protein
MKKDLFRKLGKLSEIEIAVVISIFIALILTLVLIGNIHEERFSSVYLNPASYTNYPQSDETTFIYGIKSFEKEKTPYHIQYFINDTRVGEKEVQLNPGENFEERKVLSLPDVPLPAQVRIEVMTPFETYEVHYWLKKPE